MAKKGDIYLSNGKAKKLVNSSAFKKKMGKQMDVLNQALNQLFGSDVQ